MIAFALAASAGFLVGGIVYDQVRSPPCVEVNCTPAELARLDRNRFLSKAGGAIVALIALRLVR